ncbi:MAG: hypothetical protein IH946_10345 [Bacteroidetes bacterium]|nr:hypothetical protein [Bacteroidota bacterium]
MASLLLAVTFPLENMAGSGAKSNLKALFGRAKAVFHECLQPWHKNGYEILVNENVTTGNKGIRVDFHDRIWCITTPCDSRTTFIGYVILDNDLRVLEIFCDN